MIQKTKQKILNTHIYVTTIYILFLLYIFYFNLKSILYQHVLMLLRTLLLNTFYVKRYRMFPTYDYLIINNRDCLIFNRKIKIIKIELNKFLTLLICSKY